MAAPLMRTYTAPVWQHSTDGVARLQSMGMSAAHSRQSQLSGSTALGSTTSLGTFASGSTIIGPPQNGVVVATGNIINQKADASRSLFQICVALKQRLAQVPDFEQYAGELDQYGDDGQPIDPVESLWALLRRGVPLLTVYNATAPATPLEVPPEADEERRAKKAIAKFIAASIKEFDFPAGDSFAVRDLIGSDTTGFVKAGPA
jgi:cell division control protein 24